MEEITPVQRMISACSGAIVTSLFVTPLDVVKIRMQASAGSQKCFLYCNGLMDHLCYCVNGNNGKTWYRRPGEFHGTLNAMTKIARTEGMASLWSGLSPTLLMAVPATVIYFTTYDELRSRFSKRMGVSYAPVLAGAIARSGTVTLISPLELLRTKMQHKLLTYKQLADVVVTSVKQDGIRSLWLGWTATMMRDVPFSMIYWYMYEQLKMRVETSSIFLTSFISGFTAGLTAAVVTLPLDVIKTKRQILIGENTILGIKTAKSSTLHIMEEIIKHEGVKGIFTGLVPRCVKIAPACAIMISSYELSKRFFADNDKQHV